MATWTKQLWTTLVGISAVVLLTTASQAAAQHGRQYSVTAENEHGYNLPVYHQGGQAFVLGRYGERYNIRVRNHTGHRVEAVVTVDGRDVVSGDTGDYTRQRGYVLQPYGDVLIEGFRQSMSHVAAFRFTSPGDSYSARRGTPENVGIIGVAFFRERVVAPPPRPIEIPSPPVMSRDDEGGYRGRSEMRSAPSAPRGLGSGSAAGAPPATSQSAEAPRAYRSQGAAESDSNIGTRYGESRYNQARQVTFVRAHASRPDLVSTLRYDDADGLMARGIDVYPRPYPEPPVVVAPQAFPATRFAPPPAY